MVLCYKRQYFLFLCFVLVFKGLFSLKIHLFFRRVLKLCMFLLNVECDEFVVRRRSASPFMNPWMTRIKISCIERSLFVCNAFAHRGWSLC